MPNLGQPKTAAMAAMALSINPELLIRRFDAEVLPADIDDFLAGAHLFVDGFDFFELDIRRHVSAPPAAPRSESRRSPRRRSGCRSGVTRFRARRNGLQGVFFRLDGQPEAEQYLQFLSASGRAGCTGATLSIPAVCDLAGRRGPSTVSACQLCAGFTAVAAVKLLLGRGDLRPAPWHHHFDAYRGRTVSTRLRGGNAGAVQRLKLTLARRMLARAAPFDTPRRRRPLQRHVHRLGNSNLARWAPSGDNTQPWRFRDRRRGHGARQATAHDGE